MNEADVAKMLEAMRAQLERDESAGELAGIGVADLVDAMSHPRAPEVIGEIMALEAGSVQEGDPAPDFVLPWLGSPPPGADERFTLSSRFGVRPVALVFGSFT